MNDAFEKALNAIQWLSIRELEAFRNFVELTIDIKREVAARQSAQELKDNQSEYFGIGS